jgi:predicted small metal-binding protein
MAKELRCGDLMPGCKTVIQGKDEAEVMTRAAEHAKRDHNMQTMPPDVAAKARQAIRETKPAAR